MDTCRVDIFRTSKGSLPSLERSSKLAVGFQSGAPGSTHHAAMRWSYKGELGWAHLDKLGPFAAVFKRLPVGLRPCPMSVDVMRFTGQMVTLFSASSLLMWSTKRQ